MTLSAHLVRSVGAFRLDVGLEAGDGETVALAGPSAAGKTTAVRCLAGVLPLEAGHIELAGAALDDPATGEFLRPDARRVGWLPQGAHLFPHLDAAGNVAFGLRSRGWSRREARRRAEEWMDRVGLAGRGRARPAELSGGEAQRVALARALAVEPGLLLLDEPFAGVDVGARPGLRRTVRESLAGVAGVRIIVAHDPVDALALADRVVVVEEGRVTQVGTPEELRQRPRTPYVAELAGLNLLRGTGTTEAGHPVVRSDAGGLRVAVRVEGPVLATFRPSAVALYREAPAGSPRNVLEGEVGELSPAGERVRVRVDTRPPLVAELTTEAVTALRLRLGTRVWAVIKATEIEVWPE